MAERKQAGLRRLVNLAIEDEKFRRALAASPEKALAKYGIRTNQRVLETLKGMDYGALQKLSQAFGHSSRDAAN